MSTLGILRSPLILAALLCQVTGRIGWRVERSYFLGGLLADLSGVQIGLGLRSRNQTHFDLQVSPYAERRKAKLRFRGASSDNLENIDENLGG